MSILGGFYIYRVEPNNPNITDADISPENSPSADITGVVLFKNTGSQEEPQIIFGYFTISPNILKLNEKKPSLNELADFNPINEFINTNHYDVPNADKGIYYYHPDNLDDFIRKCYIPPLQEAL